MVFENFLDPVFSPLLSLPPLLSVLFVSFLISVIIIVIYKYTTNQNLMKQLKDEMKEFQKQMKELKQHPEKMMAVQKKSMQTNMKYMSQSFRSTLFTFLPIIIIFSWMNAHYAYEAISPEQQFQVQLNFVKETAGEVTITSPVGILVIGDETQEIVNNQAVFTLKGEEGSYTEGEALKFTFNDFDYFKDVIITTGTDYAKKDGSIKNSMLKSISILYQKKMVLPYLNWGWLGTYIIFSIIFSMSLRKMFKVY